MYRSGQYPAVFDRYVLALNIRAQQTAMPVIGLPQQLGQAISKRFDFRGHRRYGRREHEPRPPRRSQSRKRPGRGRAAQQGDELTPFQLTELHALPLKRR
jgi:hypothetical protein